MEEWLDKPHVVLVGRSNVGKSSLINMLLGKKVVAVSKDPGRTRRVTFIPFGEKVYLVDVPGYGYARVSHREREAWRQMMEEYFSRYGELIKWVFLLIDSRVGVTPLDVQMIEWLHYRKLPYKVVLTKVDAATQDEISSAIKSVREHTTVEILFTSSREGKGKKELLQYCLD